MVTRRLEGRGGEDSLLAALCQAGEFADYDEAADLATFIDSGALPFAMEQVRSAN